MFFVLLLAAIILITLTVFIINNSYTNAVKKAQIAIISSLSEAAIVIDDKATIVLFNERAEKIIGISAKSALGQPIDTIVKLYTDQSLIPFSLYGVSSENNKQIFTFTLHQDNDEKTDVLITVAKSPI